MGQLQLGQSKIVSRSQEQNRGKYGRFCAGYRKLREIFTMVTPGPGRRGFTAGVGFIGDRRRLCVAMSGARGGMMVVGDMNLWKELQRRDMSDITDRSKCWGGQELVECMGDFRDRNAIFKVSV